MLYIQGFPNLKNIFESLSKNVFFYKIWVSQNIYKKRLSSSHVEKNDIH